MEIDEVGKGKGKKGKRGKKGGKFASFTQWQDNWNTKGGKCAGKGYKGKGGKGKGYSSGGKSNSQKFDGTCNKLSPVGTQGQRLLEQP